MSAYIVTDKTIDAIIYGARTYARDAYLEGFSPWSDADSIGQTLVNQNYASVNHRYGEHNEPHKYHLNEDNWRVSAILIDRSKAFALGQIYGAIHHYNYQACETPGYENSNIYHWLRRIEDEICRAALVRLGEDTSWRDE